MNTAIKLTATLLALTATAGPALAQGPQPINDPRAFAAPAPNMLDSLRQAREGNPSARPHYGVDGGIGVVMSGGFDNGSSAPLPVGIDPSQSIPQPPRPSAPGSDGLVVTPEQARTLFQTPTAGAPQ